MAEVLSDERRDVEAGKSGSDPSAASRFSMLEIPEILYDNGRASQVMLQLREIPKEIADAELK